MLQNCNASVSPQKGEMAEQDDDAAGLIVAVDERGRAWLPATEHAALRKRIEDLEAENRLLKQPTESPPSAGFFTPEGN